MGRVGPINCQSHFVIPANTKPGIYSLYWVWDFTKLTATDPSYLELYTSCMDVEVVAGDSNSVAPAFESPTAQSPAAAPASTSSVKPANPMTLSVGSTFITRTRLHTKTVTGGMVTVTQTVTRGAAHVPQNVALETIYTTEIVTVTTTV
jgi:hypothetical protein